MFRETIENEYIVIQEGTSEGTQMKYRKGDYWYKKDCRGKEGLEIGCLNIRLWI